MRETSVLLAICIMISSFFVFIQSRVYLAENEYDYLYEFYTATNGENWIWKQPYQYFGYPWNFTNYGQENPCQDYWQGLFCLCGDYSDNSVCHLFDFDVRGLNATGTIPPVVANFSNLLFYDVSSNNLYGNLTVFNNTPWIQYVNFSYNAFSGTIPNNFVDIDNVPLLTLLYFSNNHLIGTIPSLFWQLGHEFQYFNVFNNSLTGTLSNDVGLLNNSIYLNFGSNYFHGTIPSSLNNLTEMKQLFLCDNQFTSTIPINITGLEIFWVDHNRITGTIPDTFCTMKNLSVFTADHNNIGGTIPLCFGQLFNLSIFQMQNNHLEGKIEHLLDPLIQKQISVIDVSDNSISGTFPINVFSLKSLQSLAAVKNCFSGNLPETICDGITDSLQTISLDGLHTSTTCSHEYWNPFYPSKAGSYASLMGGTIPHCLFFLPNINTLHLSGNGFDGTIPTLSNRNSSDIPNKLQDIALSHNRLTGTIPDWIQSYPNFLNVDFSYNKFTGYLNNFTKMSAYITIPSPAKSKSMNF